MIQTTHYPQTKIHSSVRAVQAHDNQMMAYRLTTVLANTLLLAFSSQRNRDKCIEGVPVLHARYANLYQSLSPFISLISRRINHLGFKMPLSLNQIASMNTLKRAFRNGDVSKDDEIMEEAIHLARVELSKTLKTSQELKDKKTEVLIRSLMKILA